MDKLIGVIEHVTFGLCVTLATALFGLTPGWNLLMVLLAGVMHEIGDGDLSENFLGNGLPDVLYFMPIPLVLYIYSLVR